MAPKKRQRKTAAPAPAVAPAVAARTEWEAEKLTGKRAQKGGKSVTFTYEVQWKHGPGGKKYANSFEPAECLVGWEAEMKKIDEQVAARSQQTYLKPIQVSRAVREQKAREKADELRLKRDRLLRKQRRLARSEFSEGEEEEDEEDDRRTRMTTSCCPKASSSTAR